MDTSAVVNDALAAMASAAAEPDRYIASWKERTGGKVIGVFPMNLPQEIFHAGGILPVVIQQDSRPITSGNRMLTEFHCGYTRSVADMASNKRLGAFDAFALSDHCIQLFGAADVVRDEYPDTPLYFAQLISALGDPWSRDQIRGTIESFLRDAEAMSGRPITDDDLRQSITVFNENRELLRRMFEARREGTCRMTAAQMQLLVKSSMIMDKQDHSRWLRRILDDTVRTQRPEAPIRLHLSGHFCHAPKPELLDLIEGDDAIVVDDDLYHGARFVSTDVSTALAPIDALSGWYLDRNVAVPCPTRVLNNVDWDSYLLRSLEQSGAEAIIVLMGKFCEPHMLYYPEIKKALDARGIPHLLIETEHEGLPVETIRTRLEAMLERARRRRPVSTPGRAAVSADA